MYIFICIYSYVCIYIYMFENNVHTVSYFIALYCIVFCNISQIFYHIMIYYTILYTCLDHVYADGSFTVPQKCGLGVG